VPPNPTLVQECQEYQATPQSSRFEFTGGLKRKAVTLSCGIAGLQIPEGQRNELVFLSVADYITGDILINNHVRPSSRVEL
jgi:hypothetical protein